MESLDSTTFVYLTFISGDGGKIRVQFREDCIVAERNECYRKKIQQIQFREIVAVKISNSEKARRAKFNFMPTRNKNESKGDGNYSDLDTIKIHYVHRSKGDVNLWRCRKLTLRHADADLVAKWKKALDAQLVRVSEGRPKRLLVFINPFGGVGKAEKVFAEQVKPLFDLAGVKCDVVVTERANHARDLLQTIDFERPERIDGVVGVGGDGMFSELINGILRRAAIDKGGDVDDTERENQVSRSYLRIGVIPGGSTDALAYSLHGTRDVVTAALHIVVGDDKFIDAASVFSGGRFKRFSSTMMSYGYFGDLMARSEAWRWLGPARYDVSGAQTWMVGRAYRGVVGYVEQVNPGSDPSERALCTNDCEICDDDEERDGDQADDRGPADLVHRDVIRAKFMNVTGAMMPCSCRQTPRGISPGAHLGDGNADLIMVHGTSRFNYLRYLIRVAFQRDNPFELPFVEVKRVREFSFTVLPKEGKKKPPRTSVWNCDGEILGAPDIHVRVHRRVLRVFGRGPETTRSSSDKTEGDIEE